MQSMFNKLETMTLTEIEGKPEIKIRCHKCNAVLAYYEGDNWFMAVIMSQNKHPFSCKNCHVKEIF